MDTKSRVIVITGANRGIGFELVKRLLKNPSKPKVILTSRNESIGKEAVNRLVAENPDSKDMLHYHVLDITKKETYEPFADWIKATFEKFDVLVNNAAVAKKDETLPGNKWSLDDAFNALNTNYINTRAFTEYILPYLSEDGKVINVSSGAGAYSHQGKGLQKRFTDPKFEAKDLQEIYDTYLDVVKKQDFEAAEMTGSPYFVSKALLNAWTNRVLKNSLKGDQQAYCVCPGWCRTVMGGEKATKSAEEGTVTIEYLIDFPYKENAETNGKFFKDNKIIAFE